MTDCLDLYVFFRVYRTAVKTVPSSQNAVRLKRDRTRVRVSRGELISEETPVMPLFRAGVSWGIGEEQERGSGGESQTGRGLHTCSGKWPRREASAMTRKKERRNEVR